MQRYTGWDVRDVERMQQADDTVREEREERWLPASTVLALALWRAARHREVLGDDVELHMCLGWLGGSRHGDLYSDPLPAWPEGVDGSWQELRRRDGELHYTARDIVTWHVLQAGQHELSDTRDGTEEVPPLTLGDRVRAVRAGPYRDGDEDRWQSTVDYAAKNVERALSELRTGPWTAGPEVRRVAADLHPTLAAAPDYPALPDDITGWAWIQLVQHLTHIHATLSTVRSHYRDVDGIDSHPRFPFGSALASVLVALGDFRDPAQELHRLWAQRPEGQGVAEWDRAHLSAELRRHITALERLVIRLCLLCSMLTNDRPDG